jgi:hypothetical protein
MSKMKIFHDAAIAMQNQLQDLIFLLTLSYFPTMICNSLPSTVESLLVPGGNINETKR